MQTILDYIRGLLMPVVPILGVVLAASTFHSIVFDAPVPYKGGEIEGQPRQPRPTFVPSTLHDTEQRLDIAIRQQQHLRADANQ